MNSAKFMTLIFMTFFSVLVFGHEKKDVGEKVTTLEEAHQVFVEAMRSHVVADLAGDQSLGDALYFYEPKEMNCSRVIFICGGMGPEAGFLAWIHTIEKFPQRKIVLDQRCSIPDRTEAILEGMDGLKAKEVIVKLRDSFILASFYGTSVNSVDIFVSCNTAHAFVEPALNLLAQEVRNHLKIHSLIKIAVHKAYLLHEKTLVLSTTGTRKAALYTKELGTRLVKKEELPEDKQENLMKAIYEGIKKRDKIAALKYGMLALQDLFQRTRNITIIAACTEIPILLSLMEKAGVDLKQIKVVNPISEVLLGL